MSVNPVEIVNKWFGTHFGENSDVVLDCPEAAVECDEAVFECGIQNDAAAGNVCVFTNEAGVSPTTIDIFRSDGQTRRFLINPAFLTMSFEERVAHMTPVQPDEFEDDISEKVAGAHEGIEFASFFDSYLQPVAKFAGFLLQWGALLIGMNSDDEPEDPAASQYPHEFPADGGDGAVLEHLAAEEAEPAPAAVVETDEGPRRRISRLPSGYSADGEVLKYLP